MAEPRPPLFYLQDYQPPAQPEPFTFSGDIGTMADLARQFPPSTLPNDRWQAAGIPRDTIRGRTKEQAIAQPDIKERLYNVLTGYGAAPPAARDFVHRLTGFETPNPLGLSPLNLAPGLGTASMVDEAARKNDWFGASLAALGAAPVAGALGNVVGQGVRGGAKAAATAIEDLVRPPLQALSEARPAGAAIEGLTGALRPATAPIRGETGSELAAMQARTMTSEELDKLKKLSRQYPSFGEASRYMLPNELKTLLTPEMAAETTRLLNVIPAAERYAATGKLGAPKEGWYRASTQALIDVFGQQDAPRFASLLAATSPQTSVEGNLQNTLNIWKNWTAAGRPTDKDAIKRIMGQSVQGSKGEGSVLGAWVDNTVRALSTEDPLKITLSGPKVNSFFGNLADDVYRVTLDAHMANMSGISQDILRRSPTARQLVAGNPGFTPAYGAMGSRVRQGGEMVGMTPERAQETNWSVSMPLNELQASTGLPAREILQRGLLTPETIKGTPDFATLLKSEPRYRDPLEAAGYGQQLQDLKPYEWPTQFPSLSTAEQEQVIQTAKTLEELRGQRLREARALVPGASMPQDRVSAFLHSEAIPGAGTGHHEDLITAPYGSRESHAGRASITDYAGMDPINRALGLDTLQTRTMTGSYQPPGGALEAQPARAIGAEVPYSVSSAAGPTLPTLPADVKAKLDFSSGVRSAGLAQHATPYSAFLPSTSGPHVIVPKEKKLTETEVRAGKTGPTIDLADTGAGVNVLNWGDKMPPADVNKLAADLGIKTNKAGQPVKWERADNLGDYGPDFREAWLKGENSSGVTTLLMDLAGRLTPAERKAVDPEVRKAFGQWQEMWAAREKGGGTGRPDLMRLLELGRDKGLRGIKAALKSGSVGLPSLVALPLLVGQGDGEAQAAQPPLHALRFTVRARPEDRPAPDRNAL